MSFKFNAILSFNADGFTQGLDKASKKFKTFQNTVKSASANFGKIQGGIQGLALATAPIAVGVGAAVKTFADFEYQMKKVQSLMLETDAGMVDLNNTVKLLGATTEFSALEAGQAAEYLAQAGFSTAQASVALPGILAAASAAGEDLATTTDIVVGQLGAFGLEAKDAGHVADILSYATVATNTNLVELGEALKYAGPIAKQAGMNLQDTATSIGILANAGVKGSVAGTAIKNAILQLAKPTKEAIELFGGKKGLNDAVMETVNVNGKLMTRLKPMEVIMANVNKIVAGASDPLDAAAKAAEIFGLRGSTAFSAFQGALTKIIPVNDANRAMLVKGAKAVGENIDQYIKDGAIPQLVAFRLQMQATQGTAQKMRDIRLNSLTGQITILKSAMEGLGIEVGEVFAGSLKELTVNAGEAISVLVAGFQAAKNGGKVTEAQMLSLQNNGFKDMLPLMIEFATGFIEGFNQAKDAIMGFFQSMIDGWNAIMPGQEMNAKQLGIFVAKFVTFATVVGPILGAIAAGFFVLGPIISGISGAIGLVMNTFSILWQVVSFGWTVITAIASLFTLKAWLIIGAVTLIIGVFRSLWNNWTAISDAFMNGDILKGLKILGKGILDFLMTPLQKVASLFSGITDFLGITGGKEINVKTSGGVSKTVDAVAESAKLSTESVTQKALAQPATAEQMATAVQSAAPKSGGGSSGGGSSSITNKLELSFKGDAAKVFNKMVTTSQIENAELNGRQISPADKRRMLQNGAAASGGY